MNPKYLFVAALSFCTCQAIGQVGPQPEAAEAAKPKATSKAATTDKTKTTAKAKATSGAKAKAPAKSKKPVKKKKKPVKKGVTPAEDKAETSALDAAALAAATEAYKKELAQHIVKTNPDKVYTVRPQALLRSVVVLEFSVDKDGKLLNSQVRRSNRDHEAEATALASLREAAPLPKPPAGLIRHGKLELNETWLFNKDGRFQIRSTALQQASE
jgi:protein TonB